VTSAAPIRLAVLGAGLVGARHAEHVHQRLETTLSWIVDPNPETKLIAERTGSNWAPSLRDIPDGSCDAAIIATPNSNHLPSGLQCAERGWPCLIEKPIADTQENAKALISAFQEAGLPLLIGHHRRYHPFVSEVQSLLQSGKIGTPVFASIIWAVRKPDSYFAAGQWRKGASGGPLMINFIHEADLLLSLFGPVEELQAMTSNAVREGPVEDTAAVNIRFKSGMLATIILTDASLSPWSFEGASGENPTIAETGISSWRIGGTQGSFDFPSLNVWKDAEGGQGDWSKPLTMDQIPMSKIAPLEAQLSHFAALVRGDTDSPLVSGRDGLAALELVEAVQNAAKPSQTIRPENRNTSKVSAHI